MDEIKNYPVMSVNPKHGFAMSIANCSLQLMLINSGRGNCGVSVCTERPGAPTNRKRFHQQYPLAALALSPILIPKHRAEPLRRKTTCLSRPAGTVCTEA